MGACFLSAMSQHTCAHQQLTGRYRWEQSKLWNAPGWIPHWFESFQTQCTGIFLEPESAALVLVVWTAPLPRKPAPNQTSFLSPPFSFSNTKTLNVNHLVAVIWSIMNIRSADGTEKKKMIIKVVFCFGKKRQRVCWQGKVKISESSYSDSHFSPLTIIIGTLVERKLRYNTQCGRTNSALVVLFWANFICPNNQPHRANLVSNFNFP